MLAGQSGQGGIEDESHVRHAAAGEAWSIPPSRLPSMASVAQRWASAVATTLQRQQAFRSVWKRCLTPRRRHGRDGQGARLLLTHGTRDAESAIPSASFYDKDTLAKAGATISWDGTNFPGSASNDLGRRFAFSYTLH